MARYSDAFPRFVAKVKNSDRPRVFSVYDRERASYPGQVPGFGSVLPEGTRAEMEAEAERLSAFYAAPTMTRAEEEVSTPERR